VAKNKKLHSSSHIIKNQNINIFRRTFMTISSPEREAKKVKIAVDRNPVETNFEKWARDLKKELDNINIL
jgi:hypothetical protein